MLEKLRLFLVVVEEGSLRRAAERLHISQSAITRQVQSLEHELGGQILERTSAGVRPTNGGFALAQKAKTLLAEYDSSVAEVRRLIRGESERLRIGYVATAAQGYLAPALARLRREYPKLKVKMLDQTPGEMIAALDRGEIDLALTNHGVNLLSRDFYTRKLASVPSVVALPIDHRLAAKTSLSISQLKDEMFVRASDEVVPGYNQKIIRFCRKFGKFSPHLVAIEGLTSLAEALALCANEDAISIHPAFISHLKIPNVALIPVTDAGATWDLFVVWQRGNAAGAGPLRTFLAALGNSAHTHLDRGSDQSRASQAMA